MSKTDPLHTYYLELFFCHREEVWDCLFNISREPKNATTITDNREEVKLPQSDKQIQKTSDSSNLGTDKSSKSSWDS